MNFLRLGCITLASSMALALEGLPARASEATIRTEAMNPTAVQSAQSAEPTSLEIAQGLIGQCRQTLRLERIYTAADLAAGRLTDIPEGTRVTLAGQVNQPSFGWIRISNPANGYILATFLTGCSSTPPDEPEQPDVVGCGIAQTALAINNRPSTEGLTVGALSAGQGFQITGDTVTQTTPPNQNGRVWAPINRFGTTGWIAETSAGGLTDNIRRVDCSSIGLSD